MRQACRASRRPDRLQHGGGKFFFGIGEPAETCQRLGALQARQRPSNRGGFDIQSPREELGGLLVLSGAQHDPAGFGVGRRGQFWAGDPLG